MQFVRILISIVRCAQIKISFSDLFFYSSFHFDSFAPFMAEIDCNTFILNKYNAYLFFKLYLFIYLFLHFQTRAKCLITKYVRKHG